MLKKYWKDPVSTFTVTVLVALALIVGFISGIIFSDRAYRKLGIQSMQSTSQIPPGQMPPGMTQGDLPEGHPPLDSGNKPKMTAMPPAQQEQLPEGHPQLPSTQQPSVSTQKAIIMMEQMLEKQPDNIAILVHLGNIYFDTHQYQKSIDIYEKALKLKPDMPDVWTDCGIMYREIKKFDKAIEYFKKATVINSNFNQAYFNLAVTYQTDLEDYPKAVEAWKKFLEISPNFNQADSIRQQIKDLENAIKTGKKLTESFIDSAMTAEAEITEPKL